MVLEKTLESPLDCKEIQPVHSEGDQPWDFFGGNDAKAETPVLWPTKVSLVKAMVFPVVMYGCESWKVNCMLIISKVMDARVGL